MGYGLFNFGLINPGQIGMVARERCHELLEVGVFLGVVVELSIEGQAGGVVFFPVEAEEAFVHGAFD